MCNKCNVLESSWNHALTPMHGKIVFHETGPCAKKLWTAQSLRDGADMACRLWNLNCIKIGIVEDSFFL